MLWGHPSLLRGFRVCRNTCSSVNFCFCYVNCRSDWNIQAQDFGSGAAPGDGATRNVTPDTGGCSAVKVDALPASGSRDGGVGRSEGPSGMPTGPAYHEDRCVPSGETLREALRFGDNKLHALGEAEGSLAPA